MAFLKHDRSTDDYGEIANILSQSELHNRLGMSTNVILSIQLTSFVSLFLNRQNFDVKEFVKASTGQQGE